MVAVSDTSPISNLSIIGRLASVRAEIDALRNMAGFFIAASLEIDVLGSVGE